VIRSLTLLAVLALSAPLLAQPMAGGAVPPPRQRSGIPIGEQSLAPGTLAVRVVHDEEKAYADPGTPVHLVGISASTAPTLQTLRTNEEGRVEWKGLSHDQTTSYYVLVVIGEDRLESQMISLPPRVGMRMILSARKRDAAKQPIGDPIDDQAREREVPSIPTGEAWIALQGRFEGELQVSLRRLGDAAIPAKTVVATGEKDRREARFVGIPGGPDSVYITEVVSGGRPYRSLPFMLTANQGASRGILVYDKPLVALQGGGTMDDDRFGMELGVNLVNLMGVPYDVGHEGLVIPLPDGFHAANVSEERNPLGDRAKIIPDRGLVISGVLPPGETNVVLSFALPVVDGRVAFRMDAPFGLYQSRIFLEKGPHTLIHSAKLPVPPVVDLQGRDFYQLDLTVPPGEELAFEILGLPVRPAQDRYFRLGAGVIVVAILLWAILAVVWVRPLVAKRDEPADRRRALEDDRERLYADLVSLEKRRRKGDIAGDDYEDARRSLVTKLVLVHRELDEISTRSES
jgi:hypothetical protein